MLSSSQQVETISLKPQPAELQSSAHRTICACCGSRVASVKPLMDLDGGRVSWGEVSAKLRPLEALLLNEILAHHPAVARYDDIIGALWPRENVDDALNNIHVHASRLRTALAGMGLRLKASRNVGFYVEGLS